MRKNPFIPILAGLVLPGFLCASSLDNSLTAESERREKMMRPLEGSLLQAEEAFRQGDSEKACQILYESWNKIPEVLRETQAGLKIKNRLSEYEACFAEKAEQEFRWNQAREYALRSLQHDPRNEKAKKILEKAGGDLRQGALEGQQVNPAITDKFLGKLKQVKTMLQTAESSRETGQLDLAEIQYEEVLRIDPFNAEATKGIKKIYSEKALVAAQSRDLSNLERKREVREAWNNIYPKRANGDEGAQVTGPMTASPLFQLEKKLKEIKIPKIEFSGADLETIRRALSSLSRQFDTDPAKNGVNFIVSADILNSQPVSLKLRDVPLVDVVRYVAQIAGVKYKLSEIGVSFSPLVEVRPDLILREFSVSPSFFTDEGKESKDEGGIALRGAAASAGDVPAETGKNEQSMLENLGVKFPPGAFAVYNRNTSRLRVVNNAEMLDLIGALIAAAEEQTLLIQVGVRLVEINQSDLDSITANSTFGTAANLLPLPAGLTTNNQGAVPLSPAQVGLNGQLNQIQGVGLLPNNTLQSFLQQGVLAGTNQTTSYALNSIALGGFLNSMQFSTLITAIAQKSSANVLANPSIVLKRGQEGVIEVVQEFRYVKEYNDPQSSIRTFTPVATAGFGFGVVVPSAVPGPETVISSFPSQISDPVPIGVKLGVKPDVTGDNSRVLMELRPSFVDFEGFINYGTQINSAYAATYYSNTVTILTNNIQQPVFIKRDLTLPRIEVSDGYTLMLGGLLREDIQKIDEKVPLLGDLPILGRAFQGKTEQAIKKNTLIFVTPRILQVDGQPLNPTAGAVTTASKADTP